MTKKILAAACAVMLLSAFFMLISVLHPDSPDNAQITSGVSENTHESTSYTVKTRGDSIGIFTDENSEPIKTISIDPDSLPDDARALLEKGITVTGIQELLLLLEDYLS